MVCGLISHYRITGKLGEGGMGVVYRAHDERLDRDVAIKVLPSESFHDPAARARLLREARTVSRLNHPHICTIHEVGEADGQAYIAMELVEGRTLSARLAGGGLPLQEVLRYGLQLADALDHAHKRSVVHRDLKCANVMITVENRAKVLDFGLAKRMASESLADATTRTQLTETGAVVGTLAYMAPEQLHAQPADARSDIWALGVMLYEMAAGKRPFGGQTGFELSSAILNQAPVPLPPGPGGALPAGLEAVILRCLEKDPALRYQSSGEVRAALEAVQAGGPLPVQPARKPVWSRRRWLAVAAPLAVGLGGAVALDVGGLRGRLLSLASTQRFRSLAVLPFANLSGDPGQEYFADGITDALITDVSKIGTLKVISRTSAMQYKGAKQPLREIARALNVETVLEGSVIREAGRVRVAAQLIEAAADRNIWAESFERELSGIMTLMNEVARAIAREIRAKLRPQEETRLAAARRVTPATYEAYLRGMYHLNKATPEDLQKGMAYLQEAVDQDPADPLAYAGLAMGYIEIAHGPDPAEDSLQRAKAAAQTALKLDDTLAEALVAAGFVEGYYGWKWDDANRDIRRALDINPSLAIGHYHLSWFHDLFGRMKEAIEEHKIAQELDPFNPMHTAWLGALYREERRFDEAIAEVQKAIRMPGGSSAGHFVMGLVYQDQEKYDQAIASIQKAAALDPSWRWALGSVYVSAGRKDEARKLLAELKTQKVIPWTAFWLAELNASLGNFDEAFRWVEYPHQHAWMPWMRTGFLTGLKAMRQDPRFAAQLRRMNLPPTSA